MLPVRHTHTAIDGKSGVQQLLHSNHLAAGKAQRTNRACSTRASQVKEVVVVGAGAAGLTAAYFAAKAGARVTVLEKTGEAGQKVLISGGTRCNVLPGDIDLDRDFFTESSKSALRAIFSSWTLDSCKNWLERDVGLELAFEDRSRKWFPRSNSGKDVRDRLLASCSRLGVAVRLRTGLEGLEPVGDAGWLCKTAGDTVKADSVVMASGGLSFPSLGTNGDGMRLLETLGHTLHQPYPALTPLKGPHISQVQLAGVTLPEAQLSCRNMNATKSAKRRSRQKQALAERSAMLFTHKGFSGPAVLDLSHNMVKSFERGEQMPDLQVNWTGEQPSTWEERFRGGSAVKLQPLLQQAGIPSRLAAAICDEAGLGDRRAAEVGKASRQALTQRLTAYSLKCTGHEGYPKAEVTGGGLRLEDLDCRSLESRLMPGLHVCGELLDVFGRIGGFNFYWAWLTGRLAGLSAAQQ